MSPSPPPPRPSRPPRRGRGRPRTPNRADELWRAVPEPPPADRITPTDDPTALLRSLGTPPLAGQAAVAEHYLAAVVERASGLAVALAAATDLLHQPDED